MMFFGIIVGIAIVMAVYFVLVKLFKKNKED